MHTVTISKLFFPLMAILTMALAGTGCVEGESDAAKANSDSSGQDIEVGTGSESAESIGDTEDPSDLGGDTANPPSTDSFTDKETIDEDTGSGSESQSLDSDTGSGSESENPGSESGSISDSGDDTGSDSETVSDTATSDSETVLDSESIPDTNSQNATGSDTGSESDSTDSDMGRGPAMGEIIITEIMFNPENENRGEYFELYNTTKEVISLAGCTVSDSVPEHAVTVEELSVASGGYALIAQSGAYEENGGLTPDFEFGSSFGLNNGGDAVVLTCDGATVDVVDYADPTFDHLHAKDANGVSLTLNPDFFDADDNDDGANWCLSTSSYGNAEHKGTPGAPNDVCEIIIDCSALESACETENATECSADGLVVESCKPDAEGCLVWQETDDCSENEMLCDDSDGNALCFEPCTDECETIGASWCDGSVIMTCAAAGDGCNDLVLGVDCALTPETPICDDSGDAPVCVSDEDSETIDSDTRTFSDSETVDSESESFSDSEDSDSASESVADTGSETDSVDTDLPRGPVADEIIITEIMFNPEDENHGEYFELYNTAEEAISLAGCTVSDNDPDHGVSLDEEITVEAGTYALIAQSGDTEKNGGLTPDFDYGSGFGLNNSGDAVVLTCGDVIDVVDYSDSTFDYLDAKSADGVSLTLDPDFFNADDNDDGANWCLSSSVYGSGGHKGTPGEVNDVCETIDCSALESACETENATECSADGLVVETCEADAESCLVWQETDDCSENEMLCDDSDGNALCFEPCTDECETIGASWCDGSVIMTCAAAEDCCNDLVAGTDCALTSETPLCDDSGEAPICVSDNESVADTGSETDSVDTDLPRGPVADEIIITEIMFNPEDENHGEYFELYNTAEEAISLAGCTVSDNVPDHAVTVESLTVDPGGYALIAQSGDTEKNGGLTPDFDYGSGFGLNNSGDAVVLTCGDVIDVVDYSDSTFDYLDAKSADGVSLTLDPDFFNADDNDDGANWCLSGSLYGDVNHKGTPGELNDLCEFIDCSTLENACENEGATQCSADGFAVETCVADADGCFYWEETLCPQSSSCVEGDNAACQSPSHLAWINEFHYDDDTSNEKEGIEIAAEGLETLVGWKIELINGKNGALYRTIELGEEAVLGNFSGPVGFYYIDLGCTDDSCLYCAASGCGFEIQNGYDALILVNDASEVVQMICYEGSVMVDDETSSANGLTCDAIPVSESNGSSNVSLSLEGDGCNYEDFTWTGPSESTFGAINTGQSFSGC